MPNTTVTSLRVRVWIIEVAVLVLMQVGLIWYLSDQLNQERDRATKREEAVLIAGCERINKNAQAVIRLVEFAVVNPDTGQPMTERGKAFLDYTKKTVDIVDCSKIPERLRG